MQKLIPGFVLILIISLTARLMQSHLTVNGKEVVSAVVIAILLGIVIRNLIGIPDSCKAGASFAVKRLLRVGIALIGAQLSVVQVLNTGASSLVIIASCIVLAIVVVRLLTGGSSNSGAVGLEPRNGWLSCC